MRFQPVLIPSLALTALTSPLPNKKKDPKPKETQVITFDLDDGDIHYPDGTTQKPDGTIVQANGSMPPKIALYPDGRVCETEPPVENVMFDNKEWVEHCAPQLKENERRVHGKF